MDELQDEMNNLLCALPLRDIAPSHLSSQTGWLADVFADKTGLQQSP